MYTRAEALYDRSPRSPVRAARRRQRRRRAHEFAGEHVQRRLRQQQQWWERRGRRQQRLSPAAGDKIKTQCNARRPGGGNGGDAAGHAAARHLRGIRTEHSSDAVRENYCPLIYVDQCRRRRPS